MTCFGPRHHEGQMTETPSGGVGFSCYDMVMEGTYVKSGENITCTITKFQVISDGEEHLDDDDAPEQPNEDGENSSRLGVTLEPLNGDSRNRYRIENNVNGVLVAEVDIDGPSRDKLRPGDVILEVAQAEVRTAEEVEDRIDRELLAGRSAVLLQVHRRGNEQYIGVRVVEP